MHIYLSLYIQLETRRWPNALNMQRLVESALGYQRVTLGLTVALATVRDGSGDSRPAKRLFGLEEGGAGVSLPAWASRGMLGACVPSWSPPSLLQWSSCRGVGLISFV